MKNNTVAHSLTIPMCCACMKDAEYDVNVHSGWAYVCKEHFTKLNCKVGLGLGQALVVNFITLRPETQAIALANVRRNIIDEEGSCNMTEEELIRYIDEGEKLFYISGEVL